MQLLWNSCLKQKEEKKNHIKSLHRSITRYATAIPIAYIRYVSLRLYIALTYLQGNTRMTSVILYGSMHIAQQSLSISFVVSSDLTLFVGILAMTRFATVHSWRCRTEKKRKESFVNIISTKQTHTHWFYNTIRSWYAIHNHIVFVTELNKSINKLKPNIGGRVNRCEAITILIWNVRTIVHRRIHNWNPYRFSIFRLQISESLHIIEYKPYKRYYHQHDKWYRHEQHWRSAERREREPWRPFNMV